MRRARVTANRTLARAALAGCRTPAPDPDARREGALVLVLPSEREDSLECRRGDCADWFGMEVADAGTLEVELEITSVQRGAYWVAVHPMDRRARVAYRLFARLRPAARSAAPPRLRTQRSAVLEVEGSGTRVRAVLLEAGAAERLRPGLRGRLVDGGETIGQIELEVFEEGSRARIEGELRDAVGPGTSAEIQVPVQVPARMDPRERD